MIRKRPTLLAILLASAAIEAHAQDAPADTTGIVHVAPIVVTATRTETHVEAVASAITTITREEIERLQLRSAQQALRIVPGVSVARAGGPGGQTTAFLRGASGDQVLVLLDGVELNDPGAPAASYDFANLLLHDVARIEVLKGPASVLYGSSAMGGVVQILTQGVAGVPTAGVGAAVTLRAEAGTFGTWHAAGSVAGSSGDFGYALDLVRRSTGGISAASEARGNGEADGNRIDGLSARVDWRAGRRLEIEVRLRGHSAHADLDKSGPDGDDPNNVLDSDELTFRTEATLGEPGGPQEQRMGVSYSRLARETSDDFDPVRPEDSALGSFAGARLKLDWQLVRVLAPGQRLSTGLAIERETAHSRFQSQSSFGPFESEFPEESARTVGGFLQHQADLGTRLHLIAGGRIDDHDRFGAAATWRLGAAWELARGTRLATSAGSGFKAPSLVQLYDPQFGNRDLEPETSLGVDAGIEQELAGGRVRLGATWFALDFEDLIVFEFPDGNRNIGAARTRGIEATLSAFPIPQLHVAVSYTYTSAEETSRGAGNTSGQSGQPLIRRPRHAGRISMSYVRSRFDLGWSLDAVGAREDIDFTEFPSSRVVLDPYALLGITGGWELTPALRLFGRIENALDAEYEEVLYFGAPGRALYAGIEATL